jgi:hypothetical protein
MAKKEKPGAADAPAKPEKPREIEIASVKRTRKSIVIEWRQGDGNYRIDERDNPLPTFGAAMDALTPLVSTICHFPKSYAENGLRVTGFDLGTKGGAVTVALRVRKDLDDASKEFAFVTPERLLEQPTEEGSYTPPLGIEASALVAEAIAEAKKYVKGDRAQGQIEFDDGADGKGDDDDDTPPLKFDATGAQ